MEGQDYPLIFRNRNPFVLFAGFWFVGGGLFMLTMALGTVIRERMYFSPRDYSRFNTPGQILMALVLCGTAIFIGAVAIAYWLNVRIEIDDEKIVQIGCNNKPKVEISWPDVESAQNSYGSVEGRLINISSNSRLIAFNASLGLLDPAVKEVIKRLPPGVEMSEAKRLTKPLFF